MGITVLVSTYDPSLVLLGYFLVELWLLVHVLLIQSLVHVELCFLVLLCPSLIVLYVCISHIVKHAEIMSVIVT